LMTSSTGWTVSFMVLFQPHDAAERLPQQVCLALYSVGACTPAHGGLLLL